jgi:hypothetical protein
MTASTTFDLVALNQQLETATPKEIFSLVY